MSMTNFQQSEARSVGLANPNNNNGNHDSSVMESRNRLPSSDSRPVESRPMPNGRAGLSSFPNRLAVELSQFNKVVASIRQSLQLSPSFEGKCQQAFDVANDLFGSAPNWVCFYREMLGGSGLVHELFPTDDDFGRFLRTEQYHQVQLMLTALRSRDLPENDPNDPQRMITVRLPKSLHQAMCEEAGRMNISVNRLCISRMLQLLDPKMIPETQSKPRGRKPRLGNPQTAASLAKRTEATTPDSNSPSTAPAEQRYS